jgi:hypothetical protein
MFRSLLAVLLLVPCPGCWMQRLASAPLPAPVTTVATACDCCEHEGGEQTNLPSPTPKPDCACKQPAVAALHDDPLVADALPVALPMDVVAGPPSGPTGVTIGGYTQIGYSTGPTHSSPLRR